jgi:hypothetical protein
VVFEPSKADIQAACLKIQKGWGKGVKRRRMACEYVAADVTRARKVTDNMLRRETWNGGL